jgi:hypothetical protein
MPDGVIGLDPDLAQALAQRYERLGRELDEAATTTAARAAALALEAAAAAVDAGRVTAWRAAAIGAALAERAAAIEAATGLAAGLRDHPQQFVGSMRFFVANWSEATAWFDAQPERQLQLDPARYALLGAWRALLDQGIADGHLVVMGGRVNGVTGAHLVPSMAVAPGGSVAVGYALVDVEEHRSFDWTDAGALALDAATVAAAGVCALTMGTGCVVAGALGAAGAAVTATRLAQACLAADRSSCGPSVRDAVVDRAAPPGLLLLARASAALDDRAGRRVRELATDAVAHAVEPGPDGVVLERTDEVTITLRHAATVTMAP